MSSAAADELYRSTKEGIWVWQPTADNPWPRAWPESVPVPLCPALPLNAPLRERLRRVREYQMAEHRAGRPQLVCSVFYDEEVVCLRAGGGHATYLGTDGRVHCENFGEGKDKVVLTDPRDVASVIVRWSGDIGLPVDRRGTPSQISGGA